MPASKLLETRSGRHFGATRMSRMDMDQTIHPGWAGGFLSVASIGQFLNLKWPGYSWTKIAPIILSSLFPLYPLHYFLVFPKLLSRCSCYIVIDQCCFCYLATSETTEGAMPTSKFLTPTNTFVVFKFGSWSQPVWSILVSCLMSCSLYLEVFWHL